MNPTSATRLAATNPLFNDNRMKLGVFTLNGVGQLLSHLPPREVTWPAMLRVAKLADDAGFEALVPYARWKGIPRPPSLPFVAHDVFEPFTWAAGLAQATTYSAIFATTHIPMMHPIVVAKMAATVDHISGGRFGLNVVAGWNGPEFKMFGEQMKDHDDRYAQAGEWMDVLRRLWTEREFDFDGTFYHIEKGESFPKPLQAPFPAIMNAGGSNTGRAFAAKYAEMCFVIVPDDEDVAREQIASYREDARRVDGRKIAVWTNSQVILRDTQSEAENFKAYLANNRSDAAVAELRKAREAGSKLMTLASGKTVEAREPGTAGLVGDAVPVADEVARLADLGIDGILLVPLEFEETLTRWNRDVLPLLERAGLRAPYCPAGTD